MEVLFRLIRHISVEVSCHVVELCCAAADLATQLGNGQASFNALERVHNLAVGKLGLLHVEILFEKFLLLAPVVLWGDYPSIN